MKHCDYIECIQAIENLKLKHKLNCAIELLTRIKEVCEVKDKNLETVNEKIILICEAMLEELKND